MQVNVLTTYRSPNSLALNYPLFINRERFRQKGVRFTFFYSLKKALYECDVLFLNSKFFRRWHKERPSDLYKVLSQMRKRVAKVVWFDTNDSTGSTQFNVMPYVDRYCKNQLLKDRTLYERPAYGQRVFTEFYNKRFGIRDDDESPGAGVSVSTLLRAEDRHKLKLSWNSALNQWGDYNYTTGPLRWAIRSGLGLGADYTVKFHGADETRSVDLNCRIGISYKRKTILYHRQTVSETVKGMGFDTSKIPSGEYMRELRRSRIGISPFGWGEICYRDFDIISSGALLFKPDMSHLETWPPLYSAEKTYVPFSWDFSDLKEKLEGLLRQEERIVKISKAAQEAYSYYLYGSGRQEFCDRVMDMIG